MRGSVMASWLRQSLGRLKDTGRPSAAAPLSRMRVPSAVTSKVVSVSASMSIRLHLGHVDDFGLSEFLQTLDAHFDADAGLLRASERRASRQVEMLVDPNGAAIDLLSDGERAVEVG